jgi:hypothetical protein
MAPPIVAQSRWKCSFRSRCGSSAAQGVEGMDEDILPWIGAAHLEQDAAHADADDGADLEQLQPDGIDLGFGPLGALEGQPTQGFHQRVSHRGEVEAELIALHLIGGEAVGEQAHLLLDAVLHLAAGAVELLVQVLRCPWFGRE